jgi:uncharacterized membrane protein
MYITKLLNKLPYSKYYAPAFLALMTLVVFAYTFRSAYKRYENYEFGKFDLGNMSQIAYNTAHGNFMMVTDQFGTNINRLGMSHADYILALFSPLYWVFPNLNPMVLVFIQNLFWVSAVISIYLLAKKFTRSELAATVSGLIYLFYPSTGYIMIWSEYHGVTHIAPLLIWMFWYLEKLSYQLKSTKEKIIFWAMFVLMLIGKEQVGAIVGLFGVFVYFKNKKLGVSMFIVGFAFTLLCFLYLIPLYKNERSQSVSDFFALTQTAEDSIAIVNNENQATTRENFFLNRYTYLGDSYQDIIFNVLKNPALLFREAANEDKVQNLNYLFKPFGYVSLIMPFWLVSSPDLSIALLADVKGFLSVENQRAVLIVMTLFISYLLFLKFVFNNTKLKKYYFGQIYVIVCLILTFGASHESANPLFINGESFIKNKIISKVYSQGEDENNKDEKKAALLMGIISKGSIPENTKFCKDYLVELVYRYDPSYYSGPNPMGDHTANRYMNAMFPAGIDKTEMFISDIFDYKAYQSLDDINPYRSNIRAINKILATPDSEYQYILGCDRMAVYMKKDFIKEEDKNLTKDLILPAPNYSQEYKLEAKNENAISISYNQNSFRGNLTANYQITPLTEITEGQVAYWRLVGESQELKFLDQAFVHSTDLETNRGDLYLYDFEFIKNILPTGNYKVYYGFGDYNRTTEVYLTIIEF